MSEDLTHRQILTIFSGLMLGMLVASLSQTVVSTALPTIVGDLGGQRYLSWVVAAYLLTTTASTPLYGKISDLYGRKPVFQTAIVVFLVGSVFGGFASTIGQVIAARAVQGAGAGGLIGLSQAIVGDIVSPAERGRYQGYIGSVFAFSSVAGPLIGGFLVDGLGWRWTFFVALPIGIAALVVTNRVLRLPFTRRNHAVDYVGSALLVAGVSCILLVTMWGGGEYAWGSPVILGLVASAVMSLGAFVAWEQRVAEPILPLRLFRIRTMRVSSVASLIVGAGMFGGIVYLPVYFQIVKGQSPTVSGMLMIPMMGGMMLTSISSGRVIARTGRYKVFPLVGLAVMALGLFLLSTLQPDTPLAVGSAFTGVMGVGLGLVMQVLILAVQNAVDYADLGVATSTATFFRSMGGAVGVAVFGSVLNRGLAANITRLVPPSLLGEIDPSRLQGSPAEILRLPAELRSLVIEAFGASLQTVFLAVVPVALAGLIVVLFLEEVPLRRTIRGAAGDGEPAPGPAGGS